MPRRKILQSRLPQLPPEARGNRGGGRKRPKKRNNHLAPRTKVITLQWCRVIQIQICAICASTSWYYCRERAQECKAQALPRRSQAVTVRQVVSASTITSKHNAPRKEPVHGSPALVPSRYYVTFLACLLLPFSSYHSICCRRRRQAPVRALSPSCSTAIHPGPPALPIVPTADEPGVASPTVHHLLCVFEGASKTWKLIADGSSRSTQQAR